MFHLSMKKIDHINFLNLNQDLKVQLIWKVTLCQFMRKIRNINVWYAIKNSSWNVPWKSTSLWFMNQRNLLSVQFVMLWLYHIGSSDISFRKEKEKEKDIPMLHSFMKTVKIVSQNLKVMTVWLSLHKLKVQQGILGKFMKDKNHTCLAYARNNFLEITY